MLLERANGENVLAACSGYFLLIQPQLVDQALAIVVERHNLAGFRSGGQYLHAGSEGHSVGRRKPLVALAMITVVAGIDQVHVIAAECSVDALRYLMIQLKFAEMMTPLLALQAIDASEIELVT